MSTLTGRKAAALLSSSPRASKLPPALTQAALQAHLLLQVHDELVLECPEPELARTAAVVQAVMENAYKLSIPLSTDARWGYNWGAMNPL